MPVEGKEKLDQSPQQQITELKKRIFDSAVFSDEQKKELKVQIDSRDQEDQAEILASLDQSLKRRERTEAIDNFANFVVEQTNNLTHAHYDKIMQEIAKYRRRLSLEATDEQQKNSLLSLKKAEKEITDYIEKSTLLQNPSPEKTVDAPSDDFLFPESVSADIRSAAQTEEEREKLIDWIAKNPEFVNKVTEEILKRALIFDKYPSFYGNAAPLPLALFYQNVIDTQGCQIQEIAIAIKQNRGDISSKEVILDKIEENKHAELEQLIEARNEEIIADLDKRILEIKTQYPQLDAQYAAEFEAIDELIIHHIANKKKHLQILRSFTNYVKLLAELEDLLSKNTEVNTSEQIFTELIKEHHEAPITENLSEKITSVKDMIRFFQPKVIVEDEREKDPETQSDHSNLITPPTQKKRRWGQKFGKALSALALTFGISSASDTKNETYTPPESGQIMTSKDPVRVNIGTTPEQLLQGRQKLAKNQDAPENRKPHESTVQKTINVPKQAEKTAPNILGTVTAKEGSSFIGMARKLMEGNIDAITKSYTLTHKTTKLSREQQAERWLREQMNKNGITGKDMNYSRTLFPGDIFTLKNNNGELDIIWNTPEQHAQNTPIEQQRAAGITAASAQKTNFGMTSAHLSPEQQKSVEKQQEKKKGFWSRLLRR